MVPGSGVAVPGVAWLKPMLSTKKSKKPFPQLEQLIVMTLPTDGKETRAAPLLVFGAMVKLALLPRLSETKYVSVTVLPLRRSKKKLLMGDVKVSVIALA